MICQLALELSICREEFDVKQSNKKEHTFSLSTIFTFIKVCSSSSRTPEMRKIKVDRDKYSAVSIRAGYLWSTVRPPPAVWQTSHCRL